MKKAFAYAVIAALLGVAIMLAPLMPLFTSPTSRSTQTGGENAYGAPLSPQSFARIAKDSESSAGVVPNYPVDAITVTLMLLFSLAVAFAAFFCSRRYRFLPSRKMALPA